MKRLLSALSVFALILATAVLAQAQADVSVSLFYDNLQGGSWVEVEPYGYCWQPDVAINDPRWRPYADGYWAYTDDGWTWVSYEDFGWATYHYGRWTRLADYGWVWVPGQDWAPAWVSWRTGGNYIGWAPLPPETERIYESRPLTGHLDIEFDIGPACYNFVDVRYIGEPALSHRIVPVQQNVTYINQTVNVTNITYKNKTVYSYGPDINVVNQYSSRPIQRLRLERRQNVDLNAAAKSGGLTKVQGNALVVAAPARINKPVLPVAPPAVKAKIAQPKFEHGWSVVGDANAQSQLKEKMKTQNLKNVPSPNAGGGALTTGSSPSSSVPAMATGTQFERGKNKGAGATGAFPTSSAPPIATGSQFERGKNKAKTEPFQPSATVAPETSNAAPTAASPEFGKGGKARARDEFGQPPLTSPTANPGATARPFRANHKESVPPQSGGTMSGNDSSTATPAERKRKGLERGLAPTPAPTTGQSENFGEPRGKRKQLEQAAPTSRVPQTGPQGTQTGPPVDGRGKHRAEATTQPTQAGQPAGDAPQPQGKQKKGENPSPTPSP